MDTDSHGGKVGADVRRLGSIRRQPPDVGRYLMSAGPSFRVNSCPFVVPVRLLTCPSSEPDDRIRQMADRLDNLGLEGHGADEDGFRPGR